MSLGIALGNATSGLAATSRMAELVSANLANALTEGYARRGLELSAASIDGQGRGVRMDGVARTVDRGLLMERRGAEAQLGGGRALAEGLRGLEAELVAPPGGAGLAARLAALEGALVAAGADPSSDARLHDVLGRLDDVAGALNDGAAAVRRRRAEADADIAAGAADLDRTLGEVARLNRDIALATAVGRDAAGLLDQRQALVDRASAIVPLREVPEPNGVVTLTTAGGAVLVEGTRAARVGFEATAVVTEAMTLASGGLAGLTLDGRPLGPDGVGPLAGGSLGAAFALRDEALPAEGARLDALARDLVERFADPAADPSLPAGAAGLLTDGGAPFDPASALGLAGRLQVNAAVDPARGGALWRLRDGVGAAAPGPAGESGQIARWLDALGAPRALPGGGRAGGAAALAADAASALATRRLAAEGEEGFASARWSSLKEAELAGGVDSDREMQLLLQVEKAYAANARVIEAIDGMMRRILEI